MTPTRRQFRRLLLTFTTGNWNSAQTVTVTGVADNTADGNQTGTDITLSVNDGSSDNNFDSLSDQTVDVTTNDPWGFTVTQSGGSTSVNESGTTDTFHGRVGRSAFFRCCYRCVFW